MSIRKTLTKMYLIGCLSLPLFAQAQAQTTPKPFDENSFVTQVIQSNELLHQNQIWPGFTLDTRSLILHFPNEHTYALYFTPHNPKWQKRDDFTIPVSFLPQDLYNINNIDFAVDRRIDMQASYIYGYEDYMDASSNLHELFLDLFNMYQWKTMISVIAQLKNETYDGLNDLNSIVLSQLEIAALFDYLKTNSPEALKEFVAISLTREKSLDNSSKLYQSDSEDLFGLREYVAYKASGLSNQEILADLSQKYEENPQLDGYDLITFQIFGGYQYKGAPLGLILDQYAPLTWKSNLMNQNISMRTQVEQLVPLTDSEVTDELNRAKVNYHYDALSASIGPTLQKYQKELADDQAQYQKSSGIVLKLVNPACDGMSGYALSEKSYHITSDLDFDVNNTMGSYDLAYPKCRLSLHFQNISFMYSSNQLSFPTEFKLDASTSLNIDGHEMSLKDFFKEQHSVQFYDLKLENSNVQLDINTPGEIKAENRDVLISRT